MAKRVVIVGGGFAGSYIAKQLSRHTDSVDVTLIDIKEYFEHIPAVFREVISYATDDGYYTNNLDESLPSTMVEHSSYISKNKIIVGEVVEASVRDVTVNVWNKGNEEVGRKPEQRSVEYDFLVVSFTRNAPSRERTFVNNRSLA